MEKRGSKAQVAIEYLIIIGFSLTLVTIIMIIYAEQSDSQRFELTSSQINRIGNTLADTAEEVHYLGSPARKTLKFYFPSNIDSVQLNTNSIVFVTKDSKGSSEHEFPSNVVIEGELPSSEGVKYVSVIAQDTRVCIVEEGAPECDT